MPVSMPFFLYLFVSYDLICDVVWRQRMWRNYVMHGDTMWHPENRSGLFRHCGNLSSHVKSWAGRRARIRCWGGGTGSPDSSWIFWVIAWRKHGKYCTWKYRVAMERNGTWCDVKDCEGFSWDRAGMAGWSCSPRGSSANGPRTHQCNITNLPDMLRGSCLVFALVKTIQNLSEPRKRTW